MEGLTLSERLCLLRAYHDAMLAGKVREWRIDNPGATWNKLHAAVMSGLVPQEAV